MSNESQAQQTPEAPEQEPVAQDNSAFEAELAKTRDELLRALAEVENTRRRGERQAQDARVFAIDKFARDLLPVADTLGRALESLSPEAREAADQATRTLIAGIEMTEKALVDVFARHGVKRIGAKGEAFDPNLHQAVAQAPSDQPAGKIAEVMQPGYMLGDRTLRAAMVLVSSGQASAPPAASEGAGGGVDIKV
ncbi:MAG TPA: nucleotide exchange factor GrpE [Caulobacterales bacterium]|nr:nucleotide exchange factor GrpE [Caulobacterales bacterium]